MYGLANTAAQDALGLKNCGWWSLPGSACWKAEHPYDDPSLLCSIGIGSCVKIPPALPPPPPPPLDQAGYAPADWTVEDQVLASQTNTQQALERFREALPDRPDLESGSGFVLVAVAIGAVAALSFLRR